MTDARARKPIDAWDGQTIPAGDNRLRYVCGDCDEIFYHNPKMVVGCVAEFEDKVLLCKRAIEPRAAVS